MIRTIDLDTCDGGQKELHDAVNAGERTFVFRKNGQTQLVAVEVFPDRWFVKYGTVIEEELDAKP